MKFLHYFFLVIVSIIFFFGISISLFIASFCFNPDFIDLIKSGNIEFTSYNLWLIACFILTITFLEGIIPLLKDFINWIKSRFDKLKG